MNAPMSVIRPQPGPQEQFLSSSADIVIYGGGAGGGKTWGLLLEPLRHIHNPKFGAVFFRRTSPQIHNEGGLWDESMMMYLPVGGKPREHVSDWTFPSGATVSFNHLQHEKDKHDWQGSQICLECFDELTHFTEGQFWYLVSRNRSMCGVRPYIRATCNPDPDSWVAELIAWWIDQDTGYPNMERAGVVRYFVRLGDEIKWADSPEALAHHTMMNEYGEEVPIPPKTLTFIPALVTDNKALLATNPEYVANLMSLSSVERERLMGGNWKVKATGGLIKKEMFANKIVDNTPPLVRIVRGWDLAATEDLAGATEASKKRAATAGVAIGEDARGNFYIVDCTAERVSPDGQEKLIKSTADMDRQLWGRRVTGSLPQDPGQAGKCQGQALVKMLAGHVYKATIESGSKVTRAMPMVAQIEAGNVYMVRAGWNAALLDELCSFPHGAVKDRVDAASRAFNELATTKVKTVTVSRRRV